MEKVLSILWERKLSRHALWNTKSSKPITHPLLQKISSHIPKFIFQYWYQFHHLLFEQFHTKQVLLFSVSIAIVLYSLFDSLFLIFFFGSSSLLLFKNILLCIVFTILAIVIILQSQTNTQTLATALQTTPDALQVYFQKIEIYMRIQRHISHLFLHSKFLGYEPILHHPSLEHFKPVKMGTQCIFAKSSIVWAHYPWKNGQISLKQNVIQSIPKLIEMLNIGCHPQLLNLNGRHLDGFLFMIQNKQFASHPEGLGKVLNVILTTLSEHDPSGVHCLDTQRRKFVNNKSWFFQFNSYPIFVTTMSSCYPETHSRYAFGVKDCCFVLLQPEYSFMLHHLGSDKPYSETVWDNPTDIRDKIRVNFKANGRPYKVPETIFYPTATQMVESLNSFEEKHDIVEWWSEYPSEDILHEGNTLSEE